MSIIKPSYKGPPVYLFNGHLETIIPSLFRKVSDVSYTREKIDTPDGDFLNLDWAKVGSSKLLIISHGLEGDSERHYVRGMVKLFNSNKIDVLVWNNRSCGGEINLRPILYHHGASYDLDTTISYVLKNHSYEEIFLSGISMGGAQTLKYLGEKGSDLPVEIKRAAVYSTPCNLLSSAATLRVRSNAFYKNRFLGKLKVKIRAKATQYPDLIDLELLEKVTDFDSFDTLFTAKLHGFKDAEDFYQSVSADNWMPDIQIPTLIINALNDPLLGPECYPVSLAEKMDLLTLEMPKRGGHTGFVVRGQEFTWAEHRVQEFLIDQD
ncbi:alpha/beta fold hydrolase [Algoriphagus sp. D3-2-R+10]|uniref:YheT family hydrolase n=1 Tax=Algoriphagus aurantiacus TaxID=3103948 RepID=UPI002B37D3D0|nr:alpha/beta fold hydrolase [Algoriphagus sp. D3-2-R+10]MEB2774262.1 alpha/beta fold hydrolase [Algoriphagus sp. D3-2-R+10]